MGGEARLEVSTSGRSKISCGRLASLSVIPPAASDRLLVIFSEANRTLWQNATAGRLSNRTATTGQMYAKAFADSFLRSESVDTASERLTLVLSP